MKKKIALLLAFAMILSMIPMNVFGVAIRPVSVPIVDRSYDASWINWWVAPGSPDASWVREGDVEFRYLRFATVDFPVNSSSAALITMTGAQEIDKDLLFAGPDTFTNASGDEVDGWQIDSGSGTYSIWFAPGGGANQIVLWIETVGDRVNDHVEIPIDYMVNCQLYDWETEIRLTFTSLQGGFFDGYSSILFANIRQPVGRTISVSRGGSVETSATNFIGRGLTNSERDSRIRIREGQRGALQGDVKITLELTRGFEWANSTNAELRVAGAPSGFNFTVNGGVGAGDPAIGSLPLGTNRRVLEFEVEVDGTGTEGEVLLPSGFNLRLPTIVAGDAARFGTDVEVRVVVESLLPEKKVFDAVTVKIGEYTNFGFSFGLFDSDEELPILYSGDKGFTNILNEVHPDFDDAELHETAIVSLTELSPQSWIIRGTNDVIFDFPEGIQLVGVQRYDDKGEAQGDIVPYTDGRSTSTFGNFDLIVRNTQASLRPHDADAGALYLSFLISVEPGFENNFGPEVVMEMYGRAIGDFERSIVVANVVDPIKVDIEPTTIDDEGLVAFGRVLGESVNDIRITELQRGALVPGTTIQIEMADAGAFDVFVDARSSYIENRDATSLAISNVRRDRTDGYLYIDIESASDVDDDEDAVIVITGVTVSGTVITGTSYNIIVYGEGLTDNFDEDGRKGGIFSTDPYVTELFYFGGRDIGAPEFEPPVIEEDPYDPSDPFVDPPVVAVPVVISAALPYVAKDGSVIPAPFTTNAPGYSGVGMIAVMAVIDALDLGWSYNAGIITLTHPNGDVIVMVVGQNTASLNGVVIPIVDSAGTPAAPVIIDGRTFVPLLFFKNAGFCSDLIYQGGANQSVTIIP